MYMHVNNTIESHSHTEVCVERGTIVTHDVTHHACAMVPFLLRPDI